MSKTSIIKKFNKVLQSLLKQLSSFIGTTYYYKFKNLIKINSIMPINFWINNGLKHKDKIMAKEESYFLNYDYNYDIIKKTNDEIKLSDILRLKGIYNKIDNKSKENIWLYLQVFVQLAEQYNDLTSSKNIAIF